MQDVEPPHCIRAYNAVALSPQDCATLASACYAVAGMRSRTTRPVPRTRGTLVHDEPPHCIRVYNAVGPMLNERHCQLKTQVHRGEVVELHAYDNTQ